MEIMIKYNVDKILHPLKLRNVILGLRDGMGEELAEKFYDECGKCKDKVTAYVDGQELR